MSSKKFISKLLIAACVATPVYQYSSTVHASEIEKNDVIQMDKHGDKKDNKQINQKKKITNKEISTEKDGSKIETITFADNSRKITIVNGNVTDVAEYNAEDGSLKLNGINQTITKTPVIKFDASKALKDNISDIRSSSPTKNTIWNYQGTYNYSFDFSNKTFVQCCAVLGAVLGISYDKSATAVKKYATVAGISLAAIGATGTLSGTISVEDNRYTDEYNKLRTRYIERYYWNGSEFYVDDFVKPW